MTEAVLRRRRGVTRASLTRLSTRVEELEAGIEQPGALENAQRSLQKLESLDSEFKSRHLSLIDLITDESILETEQEVLDSHDDEVSELTIRLQRLISSLTTTTESNVHKTVSKELNHLQRNLTVVAKAIDELSGSTDDICLLQMREEQLIDFKRELEDTRKTLLTSDMEEEDLLQLLSTIEELIFEYSLKVKKLLHSRKESPSLNGQGVKLPKLDVPTFDGSILNWTTFWEQFCISVHERLNLSDAEKLVYLRHSLKDGAAKRTIEGLSRSKDCYAEAIKCLRDRYDRPRFIHQAHVRVILEAPNLKTGSGKEIRRLHDTVQQHLRALKAMDLEPSSPFITSIIELKLDADTMFEWQKHSQHATGVPPYQELLEFLDLRAQASESSMPERKMKGDISSLKGNHITTKSVTSFATNTSNQDFNCTLCKTEKHPLHSCLKFKSMSHEKKLSYLKVNEHCLNCLKIGHFVKQCKSLNRCRKCQRAHHTLLHVDGTNVSAPMFNPPLNPTTDSIPSHVVMRHESDSLLMTCRILVTHPDSNGPPIEARAILDSASSASFISERLARCLCLPRSRQSTAITGVAGLSQRSHTSSVTCFSVSGVRSPHQVVKVTAVVVPRVTCDLPIHPIKFESSWTHLSNIELADPDFGSPGRIDVLLGIDVFVEVLLHGRRTGPPNSPTAFETQFGWVLAGKTNSCTPTQQIATHHVTLSSGNDTLCKFWEIEEPPLSDVALSLEERSVMQHFKENHSRTPEGRFVVPLPKKPDIHPLGESRSQAVRRFMSLERSLHSRDQFGEFSTVMDEYFEMKHAELVPDRDFERPTQDVFYLPMHAVRKESSTTTKLRVVFDGSAKSTSGVSLNDLLLVGPTVHPSIVDVLLRFRFHRVALITDVSRMYRAIELTEPDRDLHRFVWRKSPKEPLKDYRMTRVTFGISASAFAANMSVKQNAVDFALQYPLAVKAVNESFYVDDGLTGADTIEKAIELQKQLQDLFAKGQFTLRKWNSSNPVVLQHIPPDLRDSRLSCSISDPSEYAKALGIEWNVTMDHFRITVAELPPIENITKRMFVSDIAKTYDVLGWFSPTIIKMKILLQRLWELKIGWDKQVPSEICDVWIQWRSELKLLSTCHIPRCYFPKEVHIQTLQVHGFSDASERAYFRMVDSKGKVHTTLVSSKTKVAPIKRLTIPRLELCGAHLLAQLLYHIKELFHIPFTSVYAWSDSTIVLSWLVGNPRRFKTYVGNRVSHIMELIAPDRWNHVDGLENPADCASRGLLPSELVTHTLWWNGPSWLKYPPPDWPKQPARPEIEVSEEEISLHLTVHPLVPIIPIDHYSSFVRLKRVTAWMFRFIRNCHVINQKQSTSYLVTEEIVAAETYLIRSAQSDHFGTEIETIKKGCLLSSTSGLLSLHPFVDSSGLLRVGGRIKNSPWSYSHKHPLIIHGKHYLTKLIIRSEHLRLLHAGPSHLTSSLSIRYHIVGGHKVIRSITRACVICRRDSAKTQQQMLGQLPIERTTPGPVFDTTGVDYAGPVYLKSGSVRKPTIIKAYISVFVSLTVKAVHLELVSDLTTDAFIACLRRFIARRGKPSLILSDHGSNFVGASREIKELMEFLKQRGNQKTILEFCFLQNINWKFIPERAPHFGGLWEASVKSMKIHLRRVIGDTKLTFEEFSTVLTQIEACLNSRPLSPLTSDGDGIEALTPAHFLVGRSLESLPDQSFTYRNVSLLKRWELCQNIIQHFWKRWSTEYLSSLRRFTKWHHPSRNIQIDDIVLVKEDSLIPTKWPLARVTEVNVGKDGLVRVVTVKTHSGTYKRPITKIALLLPID